MLYEDITKEIIGCSYRVYNVLGAGFLESVYHKAMLIELEKLNFEVKSEVSLNVSYYGQVIGEFKADLLIDNKVIVELKAMESIAKVHEVQLVNYLACSKIDLGLLINFGPKGVVVKRRTLAKPC